MGLCVRLSLPVVILTALAFSTSAFAEIALELQVLIAVVGVIFTAITIGQALHLREFLSKLPSTMRDVVHNVDEAWGLTETGSGELGQFSQEMRDFAFTMRDVFEQRSEMERMAHTDALTSLPNRRGLNSLLGRLAGDPADGRSLGGIGLLHLDLDHFKAVNDRLGHDAGDHVLCEATRLISAAIRDSDYLARLGGDEFVVVSPDVETNQVLELIAERIIEKFSAPILYQDNRCHVGVSIGMVLGGLRGKLLDPQRLLLNADVALCHAKTSGRNRYATFSTTMARSDRRQRNHADEIRRGLEHDLFRPWYQPVIDLQSGRATALRILPRWESSAHGFIDPSDVMDTADAFNLLEELGLRIVEHSCRAMANWNRQDVGLRCLQISLNRAQLLDTNIADKISWCLDDEGLNPEDLELCAAERFFSDRNGEVVAKNLDRLRGLGCQIVLEDFGEVSGAFSHIAAFRPAGIIMAQKVTDNLATSTQRPAYTDLLKALVGGAESLNIPITAKEIDAPEKLKILHDFGVAHAFGSGICPAKPEFEMTDWLMTNGPLNICIDPAQAAIPA